MKQESKWARDRISGKDDQPIPVMMTDAEFKAKRDAAIAANQAAMDAAAEAQERRYVEARAKARPTS